MDNTEGEKILRSLKAEPNVVGAVVYDRKGSLFSRYGQEAIPSGPLPDTSSTNIIRFESGRLFLYHRLIIDDEWLGTLLLISDTGAIRHQALNYLIIALAVFLAGLALAFMLSRLTQRTLSVPIIRLMNITKRISGSGDYSLRVGKELGEAAAEILTLSEEFDRMIGQVQAKDNAIQLANQMLEKKVEERTAELKETQKLALENAHAAGVTEITTGTLHNVGNIVNSVNISLDQIQGILRASRLPGLLKAAEMLEAHASDLPGFLGTDERGKKLGEYLPRAVREVESEKGRLQTELDQLVRGVGMIKDVVVTQQSYAKGVFMSEPLQLEQLLEDVLAMQSATLTKNQIRVVKKFGQTPQVKAQKGKLAHIVVNLIKNAQEAMQSVSVDQRALEVETGYSADAGVFIRIKDSGEGIPEEISRKIFNHGFTTKKTGHGFGLHYCANAMVEMGGRLHLFSEGRGKGATFTLVFPRIGETEETPAAA
jgi:signal transduction histidine kinase